MFLWPDIQELTDVQMTQVQDGNMGHPAGRSRAQRLGQKYGLIQGIYRQIKIQDNISES